MRARGAAEQRPLADGFKRRVGRQRPGRAVRTPIAAPRTESSALPPAFAAVVRGFVRAERVTFGGAGFGSRALKLDGRIFAMWSSMGRFVVKLPRARAAELVVAGRGQYFDPVGGRPMTEWVAVADRPRTWMALAREAHAYALASRR